MHLIPKPLWFLLVSAAALSVCFVGWHSCLLAAGPVDLPKNASVFDLFLLLGQSNMKGRGVVPGSQTPDPHILMFTMRDDQWRPASDPLHASGVADAVDSSDNAGVGPGMSFARSLRRDDPQAVIGLIPGAVGGSWIELWRGGHPKGFFDEAVRRSLLALSTDSAIKPRLKAILWLQGESDSLEGRYQLYEEKLLQLVDSLREKFNDPELPFIACTIGTFIAPHPKFKRVREVNDILLRLPELRPFTATVDARDLTGHIGDRLHYDTPSQEIIGKRFAEKYREINKRAKLPKN
jgi:hypothetical protein